MPAAPAEVVQVVVRAAVPLFGALFLGWPAGNLLLVYCADVLAALYVVCVLACGRLFAFDVDAGPAWWRRLWYDVQLALTALLPFAALAVPVAVTMALVLAQVGFDWRHALAERGLWLGVAAQFSAAATLLLREYDAAIAAPDAGWRIKRRAGLAFLRWGVIAMAAWSIIAVLPYRAVLLVAACTLAQIALELYPARVLRSFGAADLAVPPALAHDPSAQPGTSAVHAQRLRRRRRH
jgi:hypothetical protein